MVRCTVVVLLSLVFAAPPEAESLVPVSVTSHSVSLQGKRKIECRSNDECCPWSSCGVKTLGFGEASECPCSELPKDDKCRPWGVRPMGMKPRYVREL